MRILSEADDVVGPGLISMIVVLSLVILFYFAVSCIVRCFYPDMTKGPVWFVNPLDGSARWLRPPRCGDFFCCCLVKDLIQNNKDTEAKSVDKKANGELYPNKEDNDNNVPHVKISLDSLSVRN